MSLNIIFANLFSFCAIICDLIANSRKTKKEVLTTQYFSLILYSITNIFLNVYSALAQNILCIVRNYFSIKDKESNTVDWVIVFLCLISGFLLNNRGLIGYLPVAATTGCSIVMIFCKQDVIRLKLGIVYNSVLYAIFNFATLNIVGGINNVFLVIWTSIFIYKHYKAISIK